MSSISLPCCGSCRVWRKVVQKLEKKLESQTDERRKSLTKLFSTRNTLNETTERLFEAEKDRRRSTSLAKKLVAQNEKLQEKLNKSEDRRHGSENRASKLARALKNLVNTTSTVFDKSMIESDL